MRLNDCARCQVLGDEIDVLKDRIRLLESELGADTPVPLVFRLTPSETRILGLLMARPMATHDAVATILYGHRVSDDEVPDGNVAKVLVHKMRKKLGPFGVEIETVWGLGWRMSAEGKEMIRRLVV